MYTRPLPLGAPLPHAHHPTALGHHRAPGPAPVHLTLGNCIVFISPERQRDPRCPNLHSGLCVGSAERVSLRVPRCGTWKAEAPPSEYSHANEGAVTETPQGPRGGGAPPHCPPPDLEPVRVGGFVRGISLLGLVRNCSASAVD